MKRCFTFFLCACILCSLTATAFAADFDNRYIEEYGYPPEVDSFATLDEFWIAYNAWEIGYRAYAARRSAEDAAASQEAEEQEAPIPAPMESAGAEYGNSDPPLENDADDKFPLGSYVDPDGAVWSPDGIRLSPSPTPGTALAQSAAEDDPLSSEMLVDPAASPAAADPDTLAVIAGLVSDIATDPPVFYLDDLRPVDPPAEVLTGLKALVTSIFGEYTPVTTTSVVTQTVGNDTHQYLLETVAPGAAGVDYEWLAGVFLFGILLFCFMKLLGGVLK